MADQSLKWVISGCPRPSAARRVNLKKGADAHSPAKFNDEVAALKDVLFEETASGGRWDRPEMHRLLDHLRDGDTVVVWKLDRLSRSLKDVLHIMERIGNAGAGFRSITENIDTTT